MAYKTFADGVALPASDLNTYLMKQSVVKTTDGSEPSSPDEGMMCYYTDRDVLVVWNGSAWEPIAGRPQWTALTLSGTWANVSGYQTAASARIGGTIYIRGIVSGGAALGSGGETVGTLTSSDTFGMTHRPTTKTTYIGFGSNSNFNSHRFDVSTGGVITVTAPTSSTTTNMVINGTIHIA